jgi:hypothetical protein
LRSHGQSCSVCLDDLMLLPADALALPLPASCASLCAERRPDPLVYSDLASKLRWRAINTIVGYAAFPTNMEDKIAPAGSFACKCLRKCCTASIFQSLVLASKMTLLPGGSLPYVVALRLISLTYRVVRALRDPLRSVPGPFLARFSRLWYLEAVNRGHFHTVNVNLHRQHGE